MGFFGAQYAASMTVSRQGYLTDVQGAQTRARRQASKTRDRGAASIEPYKALKGLIRPLKGLIRPLRAL